MCKLSIIIPTYNIEKIEINCIDSLLNQKMNDYEIIFVDDGSTDNTISILKEKCDEYPDKIRLVIKNHTGVADTRNIGIKNSKGEYIQFVDFDDYIDDDFLNKMQEFMKKNIDIIKFKLKVINNKQNRIDKIDGPIFLEEKTGEQAFNILYKSDVLLDSPCVYLFKKEIFIKNNLFFKKGLEHEDFGLIPIVILYAKSIISLPIYGYNYIQSQNSITRNSNLERLKKQTRDVYEHYDNMLTKLNFIKLREETKLNVKLYYTNAIINKMKNIDSDSLLEFINEFRKRKMQKNIRLTNIKQIIKRLIIEINLKIYLKLLLKEIL